MRRILGFLLLAVFAAGLNFAQVAPVTHPKSSKAKTKSLTTAQVVTTPNKDDDQTSDDQDSQQPPQIVQAPARPNNPLQQQPRGVRPAPVVPGAVATAAPDANGNITPAASQQTVKLQFPNSDVQDVLRFYESLTGKKLIMDNFVTGKVNIFLSKDVPRDEAIRIIEISLLLNGFSLVPAEGDIVKVIGTGKNPRTTGVPIISDESDIPDGDHVISYLFKLRYADPQELLQALGQYLSPPQPYTSFLSLPKAGAILVTENSSVIRTLAKIIDQVDVPPAEVVSEFIKLERADASKVVDMLKDVFEKTDTNKTGQPVPGQPGYRPGVRAVANPNAPSTAAQCRSRRTGGIDRAHRRISHRWKNQTGARRSDQSDPCHHPAGQHAVCSQIDFRVRCECRICQTGDAPAEIHFGGRRSAGHRAGFDRARADRWRRRIRPGDGRCAGAESAKPATHEYHRRGRRSAGEFDGIERKLWRRRRRRATLNVSEELQTAAGRYDAEIGNGRQRQDHRRSTRQQHHHSRKPGGGGESAEDSGRDGRESAASRA